MEHSNKISAFKSVTIRTRRSTKYYREFNPFCFIPFLFHEPNFPFATNRAASSKITSHYGPFFQQTGQWFRADREAATSICPMNYDIGSVPLLDSARRPQRFPLHLPALQTQVACVVQLVH
ncbi:hypothetical protein K0M31_007334 [Melipona bicolor]|uniref:Uncharacterized protein n=1 Tax=Melipona bicolor TaxID=60889 RepID=A0AA40KVJ8_9HYME|nr:hypothetical protein K0M31_007334 [Melipona bicolor]